MNNSQFRKLVLDTPARKPSSSAEMEKRSGNGMGASATPALGSRMRSSIPMTPRSVAGYSSKNDFARQLAQKAAEQNPLPTKKFRGSKAPKGAKLPEGYVDRAKAREQSEADGDAGGDEDGDDKIERVKALEEMMKLGQLDERTFVKLREEVLGDEVAGRAEIVKGLDYALLERVRRGEIDVVDVLEGRMGSKTKQNVEEADELPEEDIDDEFEKLEEREVEAVVKEKEKKRGEMAPPALTGKKRTRDQILAEMKAQRAAAKAAQKPTLSSKFHKIEDRKPGSSRIERDGKGREVLITIDEDGNEKRKVRKVLVSKQEDNEKEEKGKGLLMPDKDAKPMGMEVPELPKEEEEEGDMDIFEGAGDDYDPLAGLDDSSDSGDEGEVAEAGKGEDKSKTEAGNMPPPPPLKATPKNYFGDKDAKPLTPVDASKPAALSDPTLLAALKKASTLAPISSAGTSEEEAEEKARAEKRRKMLAQDDRDAEDMDMGFGSSRFEDEADLDEGGGKVKLSEWGSKDDGEKGKGAKKERKRGGKKRKGDGESVADVMRVIEGRKKDSR